jgi:hypothetical protein
MMTYACTDLDAHGTTERRYMKRLGVFDAVRAITDGSIWDAIR